MLNSSEEQVSKLPGVTFHHFKTKLSNILLKFTVFVKKGTFFQIMTI